MKRKTNEKAICQKDSSFIKSKMATAGITLVALIVTIVVLLILAGITLTFIMGDNSVFNQASQAKIQTELGKIEEQAGILYSDKYIDKQTGEIETISNREIVDELIRNGNAIEIRTAGAGNISEISVEPKEVSIDKGKTATIKVSVKGPEDGNNYYAVIDGKYYKMNFDKGYLRIERNETTPEGNVETPSNIEIETGYDTTIVANAQINQNERTIKITSGESYGNTTLIIKCGKKDTTCKITVEEAESNWEELEAIAELIAKGKATDENGKIVTATSNSSQATVMLNGESKTIKVGDKEYYKVKYDGEIRRVRVLGFLHDDLAQNGAYDGAQSATKAGISFEFLDFITGATLKPMNSTNTNEGGWEASAMRKFLAGTDEEKKGINVLSNKKYIKQVTKKYIKTYNDSNPDTNIGTSNDYLWLLACSEIVTKGDVAGHYGYAITSEGNQYQYYKGVADAWNIASEGRKKYPSESGSSNWWWLRSPTYNYGSFCIIYVDGYAYYTFYAMGNGGVAPGFAI